jgi:hypothetical protein
MTGAWREALLAVRAWLVENDKTNSNNARDDMLQVLDTLINGGRDGQWDPNKENYCERGPTRRSDAHW